MECCTKSCLLLYIFRSQLHFVRCIKPNARQKADCFDQNLVLHQLKCCGILEVARIARAGYPTRYSHQEFVDRYERFMPDSAEIDGCNASSKCEALFRHFGIDGAGYQLGKSKIFFKAGVLGHLEDHLMRAINAALRIQRSYRMHVCRRNYLEQRKNATTIQSIFRSRLAQREFKSTVDGIVLLQQCWRRSLFRRRAQYCLESLEAKEALAAAEEEEEEKIASEETPTEPKTDEHSITELDNEFGMDIHTIRNVLHQYKSGLLVPSTCENADSALQELQKINIKLQKEYEDLKDENAILLEHQAHGMMQKQPHVYSITAIPANANGEISADPSEDSVSIMSYSDTEVEHVTARSSSRSESQMKFGRAGANGAVAALQAELEKKAPLFDDDAAFIQEVHDGVSHAPKMDPDFEIERLLVRYKSWHRDFKARLKSTQQSLRKSRPSPGPMFMTQHSPEAMLQTSKVEKKEGLGSKLRNLTKVGRK